MAKRIETIFAGVDEMTAVLKKIQAATESTSEALTKQKKASAENEKQQSKSALAWTELKSKVDLAQNALSKVTAVVSKVVEFAKMGAQVERTTDSFNSLAQGAGQSGDEIVRAIQEASSYTIDKMTAMSAANKAMLLNVAESPEDFAKLAKHATLLGRAMGQDAAKSIDDFVTAAGRQSKMIADNLGLMVSAEDANLRYAKANKTTVEAMDDAAKKQAFLQEMIRQAEEKTQNLGGATLDTAGAIEMLEAAASDASAMIGKNFVQALMGSIGAADVAADSIRGVGNMLGETTGFLTKFLLENNMFTRMLPQAAQGYEDIQKWLNRNKVEIRENIAGYNGYRAVVVETMEEVGNAVSSVSYIQRGMMVANRTTMKSQEQLEKTILDTVQAFEDETEAMDEARDKMEELRNATQEFQLDAGIQWTDYHRDVAESAADYAKEVEDIEAKHQENLAELAKRGQSRMIQIDEEAEKAKLDDLKYNLAQALLKREEMSDKAAQSTVNARDRAIETAQEEIAAQEKLLDDFYNGRLVKHGENVSALTEQEKARYAEELRLLEENRRAQEEEQRRSLGQMILQQFDAWAQLNGVTGQAAYEMRLAIAEEYGLIETGAATAAMNMSQTWDEWKHNTNMSIDAVIIKMGLAETAAEDLRTAILNLPDKTVNIDVKINRRSIDYGGSLGEQGTEAAAAAVGEYSSDVGYGGVTPGMQRGGFVRTRQAVLVGEWGPEMAAFPPGTRIYNAIETRQILAESRMRQDDTQGSYQIASPSTPGNRARAGTGVRDVISATAEEVETTAPRPITYVMTVHVHGDVWSDAKVLEIMTAMERLAPQSGVRVYSGAYQA